VLVRKGGSGGAHPAQNEAMTIIFWTVALLGGSFALMINALRRAPEGYQDEKGFHFIYRPPVSSDRALSQDESLQTSRKVA
jgi:hypothetical protein